MNLSFSKIKLGRATVWILILCFAGILSNEALGQTELNSHDFTLGATGLGLAVGVELFAKDRFLPSEPRFSTPNQLDITFRSKMLWEGEKQEQARIWSDRLIYGVSLSSLVWGPLLAADHELAALINMEVFAVNSLLTNLVKIGSGRERPYHYFHTRSPQGPVDFASFFSGHSSVAFSQAVTNGILLSEAYPDQEALIWTSLMTTAGITAYLRVAGDMHYFTDIVVGAGVGSLIAWSITQFEMKRFEQNPDSGALFRVTFKIPLG